MNVSFVSVGASREINTLVCCYLWGAAESPDSIDVFSKSLRSSGCIAVAGSWSVSPFLTRPGVSSPRSARLLADQYNLQPSAEQTHAWHASACITTCRPLAGAARQVPCL
jgi:hypothetical protein